MRLFLLKLIEFLFRQKSSDMLPSCFGKHLTGNIEAERCCFDCSETVDCIWESHFDAP